MTLSAAKALRSGVEAAGAAPRFVLPLWLAAFASSLLGVVPVAWLGLDAVVRSRGWGLPLSEGGFWLGLADALGRPTTWLVVGGGVLLGQAGGWLVQTVARIGVTMVLARQVGRPRGAPLPAWGACVLEAPERWLAASGLALVLTIGAFVSALGLFGTALTMFVVQPGIGTSAAMAFAVMGLAFPVLADAALTLGAARSALVDEGPIESLASGVRALFERTATVLLPWLVLELADVAVALVTALVDSGLPGVAGEGAMPVLGTVARGGVLLMAALGHASVALVRQGTLAALVEDAEGRLPKPPPPAPPEPVFEAVALKLVVNRDADEPGS